MIALFPQFRAICLFNHCRDLPLSRQSPEMRCAQRSSGERALGVRSEERLEALRAARPVLDGSEEPRIPVSSVSIQPDRSEPSWTS
jgi:hypothetical protein